MGPLRIIDPNKIHVGDLILVAIRNRVTQFASHG